MAPEQAMGDPATDHRADIYSFGCVAYELFAGTPPFPEPTSHQVVAAHMTQAPRPVTELRAEVPLPVADLIARCLAKLPADRPQQVRDVLGVLDGATTTGSGARVIPASKTSGRTQALRLGAVAVALTLISTFGYRAMRGPTTAAPITLAVLPFGNMNADSAVSFVEEGLADEVASVLSRVPGILIKSRSGARLYRGQLGVDVSEAGVKLKADYIMHGVVRLERGLWILAADLARASDATSIWDAAFTLNPDQQAGSVETIASSVVSALRSQFPNSVGTIAARASNRRTANNEAFRLYLRGQERLSRRRRSVTESADLFRQAIREDSSFAAAYSGLSVSLALFPYFQGVPAHEILPDLVSAAHRAMELDPSLGQPHVALGMAHWFTSQWDSAGAEFETAIRLDPNDVEARVQYARHLRFLGHHAESMRELQIAREQDPASALVLSHIAYAFYLLGDRDSALVESRRALENDSLNLTSLGLGAMVRLNSGLLSEARLLSSRAPTMMNNIYIMAKSGDSATARHLLRELESTTPLPWMGHTRRALGYVGLGDTASALSALEQATEVRENWASQNGVFDPMFAPLRRSARFQALVKRVGLVDPASGSR
jgi:serine/threonine-protein kinase